MNISITKRRIVIIFTLIFFINLKAFSTHLLGGEISYEALPGQGNSYKIIIVTYTNETSDVAEISGIINFGDGSGNFDLIDVLESSDKEILSNGIAINTFIVIHTYPSSGNYYISFTDSNRSSGIANSVNSTNSPFYIDSNLIIDPFLGTNSSPEFKSTPNFSGKVGQKYIEELMVQDTEEDSLAFYLLLPREAHLVEVPGYVFPQLINYLNGASANEDGTGKPTLIFDRVKQQLIWDAPAVSGNFLVSYKVEEWRRINGAWHVIGYSTREFNIKVEESGNNRPFLIVPQDTVLEAGKLLEANVLAQDPDGDDVTLESSGIPYILSNLPAEYSKQGNQIKFSWQTHPDHVSNEPYEVEFKVVDIRSNSTALYDHKVWKIYISSIASFESNRENNTFRIFPNPSSGIINISATSNHNTIVSIFDLQGKLVYENKNLSKEVENIDLQHLIKGVYIVKLKGAGVIESKKLMLLK